MVEVSGGVVFVVCQRRGGRVAGADAAGNGDAGVARCLRMRQSPEGGGVFSVIGGGAFREELDKVRTPSVGEEVGVYRDTFAANG